MNQKRGMARGAIVVVTAMAVALVLGLVFAAWLQPDMAFTLANQLWNCF